jgi:hypothetical protein
MVCLAVMLFDEAFNLAFMLGNGSKTPRLKRLRIRAEKKPSMTFSQEAEVGVMPKAGRNAAAQPIGRPGAVDRLTGPASSGECW